MIIFLGWGLVVTRPHLLKDEERDIKRICSLVECLSPVEEPTTHARSQLMLIQPVRDQPEPLHLLSHQLSGEVRLLAHGCMEEPGSGHRKVPASAVATQPLPGEQNRQVNR